MGKARMAVGLMAGCLLLAGTATTWAAAPTVAQMLGFRPKQEGIICSTPTPQEQEKCKVELQKAVKGSSWILRDETGQILRRYSDTNGDNKINVWSYYHKGIEVYREIDSNANGKVDQYRWLNAAGSKWGLDPDEDGKIDSWKVISPEEVSQEVLQAVIKKDYGRLQALLLTEAELRALDLPPAEVSRIRDSLKKVQAKFQETAAKFSVSDKVRWDHLELPTPQCIPAEGTAPKQDVLHYLSASVLYQDNDKSGWLQMGELIQVGAAWRLIDGPVPGQPSTGLPDEMPVNKDIQALLEQLQKLDQAPPADTVKYNLQRADLLEKVVGKMKPEEVKPEERDQWLRQVADCLSTAAQNGDKGAMQRLEGFKEQVVKAQPGGNLAAYIVYSQLTADYSIQLANPPKDTDLSKLQKDMLERWGKFVQEYPQSENTPDALLQLGMVSELMADEPQAKKWYEMLAKNFPNNPQANKVRGAVERLALDGKELSLAGARLTGGSFDLKSLRGKVVVVYYWASWNQQSSGDFGKFKALASTYGGKGLEIVCVNLDETPAAAREFLQKTPSVGTHLFEQGGLNSKLAEQYGIMVLPTMFLVNKEGKVVSRTVQMNNLEDEVKKLVN